MSKLTLEYTLPEEREEADIAVNAGKYYSILLDVDNYCRSAIKHDDGVSETTEVYLEHIREIIREEI